MPIDFPSAPATGQRYTYNNRTWEYDGAKWITVVLSPSSNIQRDTAKNTTSGTSVDFTAIPSWVRRITVILLGVSTNGTSPLRLQIGTGGSPTTSGYIATSGTQTGATVENATNGFTLGPTVTATDVYSGNIVLTNITGNTWVCSGTLKRSTTQLNYFAGEVALAGVLDMVRLTTNGGTDAFDAGSYNIFYE